MMIKKMFVLLCRVIAAVILLQTLFFKFTAQSESVELFTKLGVEPWGRIGTGVIELVIGILLLYRGTAFIGAFLGMGVMLGALLSHLTVIGIESKGDGGQLFILAMIVFALCIIIQLFYLEQGKVLLHRFFKNK
jgi:putative oxidoreductase